MSPPSADRTRPDRRPPADPAPSARTPLAVPPPPDLGPPAGPPPLRAPAPDLRLTASAAFVAVAGLVLESVDGAGVEGHVDLGPEHHTPWGIVNGGVYTTAVESAACAGASAAVAHRGQRAVAVHVATDLLRARTGGRVTVRARPVHQGRTQQIWTVTVSDGGPVARGQVRLAHVVAAPADR
ncbi:PaaI family thioesterase [Streptomyces sp. NPDC014894]|uniref:PaaI family thioesterase n=1 Tax=Streptomyces sp. NPDC014894 TaxID=3364931 RepID=UPI0036F5C9C5